MGIQRPSKEVIERLANHHGGRDVCLAIEHRPSLPQDRDQRRIFGLRRVGPGDEAERRVVALDLEVVLDGDGKTGEGPKGLAVLLKVGIELGCAGERFVEEDLREAVGLDGVSGSFCQMMTRIGEGEGEKGGMVLTS